MSGKKLKDILKYKPGRKPSDTIKKAYLDWRQNQNPPIPLRCDISTCYFHTHELIWNGKELKPILDHINGVNGDNNPINLRFICSNCNSQQQTTGGGNKGRVTQEQSAFSIKREDGSKEENVLPEEHAKFGDSCDADVIKAKTHNKTNQY
ncbi:MAG: hypothetical protein GXP09_06625 [Gammaproteobacteria bacterium]|nr:hypothetical protein [Gammaproteobacteria bacterium]